MRALLVLGVALTLAAIAIPAALGDTLELKDGTILRSCYVRDEGSHFVVWESAQKVGTLDYRVVPRSWVAEKGDNPHIERPEAWDAHPQLPDLSVTYIEMNPKLAGLHGLVQYEGLTNAPWLGGAPALDKRVAELETQGKSKFLNPEYIVQDLKLKYNVGEEITFTAHVKNLGFAPAQPFQYRWLIDDKEVARGTCEKPLKEMEETSFDHKWAWQEGFHTIGFEVGAQREIATINNKATDAMWGWGFCFIVDKGRAAAYHRNRTAYGTFSWEDYYRWHITIMNQLFAASVYPSAPDGIIARVRLDRVVYLDDVTTETYNQSVNDPDGMLYLQGCWTWSNSDEENTTGVFADPLPQGRNSTEWSLPHELGHQLGLVDYYAVDYAGDKSQVWPDNGEMICRIENHPFVMMHWHGPFPYSEMSAAYLNATWDKPRGHFGDHYFAIPDECFLRIVDVNGKPVPNVRVEVFQRGETVDKSKPVHDDQGVMWYEVIEDGNFGLPVSKDPVIVGQTNQDGILRLPNRDVKEVKTFNGYHRKPNAWGNINVVGGRGLMLVKVVRGPQPAYFYLEAIDFNVATYTGHDKSYTVTLKTPYGSADSPRPPVDVRWEYTDRTKKLARVMWRAPGYREQHPYERPIAFRVYRRVGPMALNDRPWFPVVTLDRDTEGEFIVDLTKMHESDVEWFSHSNRFAVSTIGLTGIESELVQAQDLNPKEQ